MHKLIFASLGAFAVFGVALAHGDDSSRRRASRPPAVSIEQMKQKIDALGYDVRRMKVEHGVFKTRIVDRDSGGAVKARFDVATGELVRAELDR